MFLKESSGSVVAQLGCGLELFEAKEPVRKVSAIV